MFGVFQLVIATALGVFKRTGSLPSTMNRRVSRDHGLLLWQQSTPVGVEMWMGDEKLPY